MNIGEKLFKLRKDAKLSQEKLAEKLGVSRQTLANWESNITSPSLDDAKKISEILKVSIDEIIDNPNTFLENKISNTEKLAIKSYRFNKITLYILFLIICLIVAIIGFTKRDFTGSFADGWVCRNGSENLELTIEMEDNMYFIHVRGNSEEVYPAGNSLYEAVNSLKMAKEILLNQGATCR